MTRSLPLVLLIALFAFAAAGCVTTSNETGKAIPQSKVDQIVKGETNMTDIIGLFGSPEQTSSMGGKTLYTYKHTIVKGSGMSLGYYGKAGAKELSDELTITFDEDGVVETYNITRGIDRG